MIGLFSNKASTPDKIQRRVERLRRRRKYTAAIELQQEVCEDSSDSADWLMLADLARESERANLELTARVSAAKLKRTDPKEWIQLADLADSVGAKEQSVAALFRAADAYAVTGESGRAIELFDRVLAQDPKHRMAQRLRQLLAAKSSDDLPDTTFTGDDDREDERPDTLTYLRSTGGRRLAEPMGFVYDEPIDMLDVDEITIPGWAPDPTLEGDGEVSPSRYVSSTQTWPTVLDRNPLIFVGAMDELGVDLEGLTEEITLAPGAPIFSQGQPSQLLYCLKRGVVRVGRKRHGDQDLGQIEANMFFGELGPLMGLPSTTTATADEECQLSVVTHERIQGQISEKQDVPTLIRALRGWYLDTVFQICPISRHDSERWRAEQEHIRWYSFAAGDRLANQGDTSNLYLILTGYARITHLAGSSANELGYICPGDLCGEIDPSPVTVVAETTVCVLRLNRKHISRLPRSAVAEWEERLAACRAALSSE